MFGAVILTLLHRGEDGGSKKTGDLPDKLAMLYEFGVRFVEHHMPRFMQSNIAPYHVRERERESVEDDGESVFHGNGPPIDDAVALTHWMTSVLPLRQAVKVLHAIALLTTHTLTHSHTHSLSQYAVYQLPSCKARINVLTTLAASVNEIAAVITESNHATK